MRITGLTALCAALALWMAPSAAADGHVPWTAALAPAPVPASEYDLGKLNDLCEERPGPSTYNCVKQTIKEMERRYDDLLRTCDHRGLFALAYLRTTEEYQRASLEPGFFADVPWVNHEDTIFAQLYFDAYDDWEAGRHDLVPRAWKIAFQAADDRSVSGVGDVLLGISAHINRDLAYTLAASGLVDPEGRSRKPDHDAVNGFLVRVPDPLFRELRSEWDPAIVWVSEHQTAAAIALVQEWREAAWRWAERLVSARTDAERALVEAQLEDYAARTGEGIARTNAYPPGQSSAARDAHCQSRR